MHSASMLYCPQSLPRDVTKPGLSKNTRRLPRASFFERWPCILRTTSTWTVVVQQSQAVFSKSEFRRGGCGTQCYRRGVWGRVYLLFALLRIAFLPTLCLLPCTTSCTTWQDASCTANGASRI